MEWQDGTGEEWNGDDYRREDAMDALEAMFGAIEELREKAGLPSIPRPRYYILHGDDSIEETDDLMRASLFYENGNGVEKTLVRGPFHVACVSTVFLFMHVPLQSEGAPRLFETMIFDLPGHTAWEAGWRYTSVEEARASHKKLVRQVLRALWLRPLYRIFWWLPLPWPKLLHVLPAVSSETRKKMLLAKIKELDDAKEEEEDS